MGGKEIQPFIEEAIIGLEAHSSWSTDLPMEPLACSVRFVSIVVKSQREGGVIAA